MGPMFHETRMGQKFYNADIPNLIRAINRLADAIEKQNALAEGKEVTASEDKTEGCD